MTKDVRLEAVLDPHVGKVSGDAGRLQQVFWNLLSNAIKFTPAGGKVQVLLQRVDSHIEVSVSDTGVGIPAGFLPHVFERFSQKDSSTSREHGGLGLGLAITKQLVELHGGSVQASSAGEGQGATFAVKLPLVVLDAESFSALKRAHPTLESGARDSHFPDLHGIRALVVDDEPEALELIRRVLEERGAVVAASGSGHEALQALGTSTPDVIISDIGMPVMDGFEFMRRVREREERHVRVPALALTAFARPEDRKRAILSGYQSHLAKPFDVSELVIVVAGLTGKT